VSLSVPLQSIQFKFADMMTELVAARQMVRTAAQKIDQNVREQETEREREEERDRKEPTAREEEREREIDR
jgi:alkylation response protein AidB-like acyl-CoA dehydrogenase